MKSIRTVLSLLLGFSFVTSAVPTAGLAGDIYCSLKEMDRHSIPILSRSDRVADSDYRAQMLPIVASLSLDDAPLEAIGKITAEWNSRATPICTGVLVLKQVVFTSYSCLANTGGGGKYFFPASKRDDPAPRGGYVIDEFVSPTGTDVAIALLKTPVNGIPVLNAFAPPVIPKQWKDNGYWFVAGYRDNGSLTAHLESGCRITDSASRDIQHDCDDDFLEGAPIFAKLCGEWGFIGMKTAAASHSTERTTSFWFAVNQAFEKWGLSNCLSTKEPCQLPTQNRPSGRFNY